MVSKGTLQARSTETQDLCMCGGLHAADDAAHFVVDAAHSWAMAPPWALLLFVVTMAVAKVLDGAAMPR